MKHVVLFGRRHWPAVLALVLLVWRATQDALLAVCAVLGVVGALMNLIVTVANGRMPVAVRDDDIEDADRPYYRPIDLSTRLPLLADWIPVRHHLISSGDVLLMDRPWNRAHPALEHESAARIQRVRGWDEISRLREPGD